TWTDEVTGEKRPATEEDLPMKVARYYLLRGSKATGEFDSQMLSWISWPTHRWLEDDGDMEVLTVNEFISYPENSGTFCYFGQNVGVTNILGGTDNNGELVWGIWSNELINSDGSYSDMSKSIYQGVSVNFSEPTAYSQTQFTLKEYDADDDDYLESNNQFYLDNNSSIVADYAGEANVTGFVKYNRVFDMNELHLFYAGEVGTEILGYDADNYWYPYGYPNVDSWGPLQKFYIVGVDKALKVCLTDGQYITDDPVAYNSANIGVTSATGSEVSNRDFHLFRGALYSADNASSETPAGKWELESGDIIQIQVPGIGNISVLSINPVAGSMVPYGYSSDGYPWSPEDGLQVVWKAQSYSLATATAEFGTKSGASLSAEDLTGSTYTAVWDGKVIYHYDPSNMQLTREIESVGSLDSAVKAVLNSGNSVVAANGTISVVVENAEQVSVYTAAGARVASSAVAAGETFTLNADKGVYIVKIGKQSQKVVL
ncbi:MAG: hypothetical protein K2J92_00835, partial [Muribaculaceae bacterium]|nr:hypothetical protein [Muribaculaceae bacterium]